jgi:hypothetical protein
VLFLVFVCFFFPRYRGTFDLANEVSLESSTCFLTKAVNKVPVIEERSSSGRMVGVVVVVDT